MVRPMLSSRSRPKTSCPLMRHFENGQRLEALFDFLHIGSLRSQVAGKQFAPLALRQHPVHNHGVGIVAVELQVGVGSLGLLDHHAFGIGHKANTANVRLLEDLLNAFELAKKGFQLFVAFVDGNVHGSAEEAANGAHGEFLARKGAGKPALRYLRQAQQGQGLACRRRIDYQQVVLPLAVVLLDPEKSGGLFHAG